MAKILVVDDERVLVKGIKFNLENEGYQVQVGYDGEEVRLLPLPYGEKGELVFTTITKEGMPMLRYRTHDICTLFRAKNIAESCGLQLRVLPLIRALFSDVNPIPVKDALNLMGFSCGACRLPLWHLDEGKRAVLCEELRKFSLIA